MGASYSQTNSYAKSVCVHGECGARSGKAIIATEIRSRQYIILRGSNDTSDQPNSIISQKQGY